MALAIAAMVLATAAAATVGAPAAAHEGGAKPAAGVYRVVVEQAPRGVVVHPLQGRVAGFFVEVDAGHRMVVHSADGAELARVGAPGAPARASWLDDRVRMPAEPSPHDHITVVRRWRIPVVYDDAQAVIGGVVRWVPVRPHDDAQDDGIPTSVLVAVNGASLVAGAGLLILFRRKRGGTTSARH